MKKYGILCLLLCLVLLVSSGCAGSQKFSREGLTITLTSDFSEEAREPYTACYRSGDTVVFTLRQEFELFEGGDVEVDLDFFTEYILEQYGAEASIGEEGGIPCFTFSKADNVHYVFTYEGKDAFWVVEICCTASQAEALEKTILSYAKSVKV